MAFFAEEPFEFARRGYVHVFVDMRGTGGSGGTMPLVPAEERRDIVRLRSYPEETAGAIMTTEFARVAEDVTVSNAFQDIAAQAQDLETIYYLYVVDQEDHLRGVLSARDLVSGYELFGSALRLSINPSWQLDARVDNLFDEEYEVAVGFPGPERSFRLGATFRTR